MSQKNSFAGTPDTHVRFLFPPDLLNTRAMVRNANGRSRMITNKEVTEIQLGMTEMFRVLPVVNTGE